MLLAKLIESSQNNQLDVVISLLDDKFNVAGCGSYMLERIKCKFADQNSHKSAIINGTQNGTFDGSRVGGESDQSSGGFVLDRVRLSVQQLKDAADILALKDMRLSHVSFPGCFE